MNRNASVPLWLWLLFPVLVALDQATKIVAVSRMGDLVRDGFLVSDHARRVLGDWIWLFIAYNPGSAFSLTPQKLAPFLSPNVFFTVLTLGALGFLYAYMRRHPETLLRAGALCIGAGALGNLIDRWRLGHVVDFLSVGVPGIPWRWPTFNVADVAICTGVGILLFGEWVVERTRTTWVDTPSGIGPRITPPSSVPADGLEATMTPSDRSELPGRPGGADA